MAGDKKRSRRGEEPVPEVPVLDPVTPDEGRKERGGKKAAAGGGFPGSLPAVTGLVAGLLAFGAVVVLAGAMGPKDEFETLDAGGVQASRLMGALDIDRWKGSFGSVASVRRTVTIVTDAKKAEARNADDFPQFEEALARWFQGDLSSGAKWRPGFDVFFPKNDTGDEIAKKVIAGAILAAEESVPDAFLGAMVLAGPNSAMVAYPETMPASPGKATPDREVGKTKIFSFTFGGKPARWYETPMRNRLGQPEGSAVVVLSTASAKPFPVYAVGGAAFALAFLGGLITASLLAGGTKNALAKLASDADSLAKGNFDTKVSMGGPSVVQQVAKSVQKLAAVAQSGAAAPPQVMVQEVVRAPVQEINESLAPAKGFERPDGIEVEATQKTTAEVGNDYYDLVNVDAENVGVFIADIPVRGVKSSMHMAAIRALFRENAKGQQSPAELLKAVNRGFAIDLPRGVYVTAMYAIVNVNTGICKVASAQHLPLIFYKMSKKAAARLTPEGIALGLDPGPVFDKTISEKAVQLEKGDRIVMFTDGAINGRNPSGAQYGDERFYYVVNREAPKNSAACVNFVANDVDLFHEGAPLTDDFTLVTLRKLK